MTGGVRALPGRERTVLAVVLLAAAVLFVVHGLSFGNCLQDDTYITLRYSQNLAAGHGLVFNPGERVEGYTNFSWTLLTTLPFLLGLDPATFVRVLGFASGLLALLAVAALTRRLDPSSSPLAPAAAVLLVCGLPYFVAESVMGLETAFFAALAAFAVERWLAESDTPGARPWSGAVFALAALTRPEGVMIAGMVGLADLWRTARTRAWRTFWTRWLMAGVPVALHLAFRIAYYGDIVPNTFHAKVGGGLDAISRGLAHTGEFARDAWPLLMLAVLGAALVIGARRRLVPGAVLAVVIPAVFLVYVVYVGGDYKPTYRFFATPSVFLAALAGLALAEGATRLAKSGAVRIAMAAAFVAGSALILVASGGGARDFALYRAQELPVHLAAGRWFGQQLPPGTWIATCNAGALPYASGLPTIDMCGLCDAHIARRPMSGMGSGMAGHEKSDAAYVVGRKPAVILLMASKSRFSDHPVSLDEIPGELLWTSDHEMWDNARFHDEYELKNERLPGFYVNYFARKLKN